MSQTDSLEPRKPTAVAGCTIFLVILGMVTFLAIFSWQQYGSYKAEIINISQLTATPTLIVESENNPDLDALTSKISTFASAVKAGEKAEISFSPEDMNLAIAHYPKLKTFKGKMAISKITEKAIIADISFEVRAGFDGTRYLNGTMTMEPVVAMGSLFPIVTDITPDSGNPVPPKFTREFPTFLFTEYRNDETLAKVFHKLSTVTLSEGKMTILSDPSIKQPDAMPDNVDEDVDKALYLFGLFVFIFVTSIAFLLWIRNRNKNADA